MKMAKPSARDIEAAEELMQVLQLIDARFGGPWANPEAGEDLNTLLEDGTEYFDSDNITHLQTLYNNLARLLRNAPNFHGRVISGMCHVIMYEKNQILDPASDCIDLHPRFAQAQAQIEQLQAECQMLRGLTPEPPPRPPEGEGLPRYGIRWNGPGQPLSVPMDDGYWTPWHLANSAADHSEDARPMVPDFVSATDVRGACQDAVDVFAEQPDADQCREVAEYMREVLLALIERRKAAAPQQSAGDTL
ncbi:MAG: hypothetical protein K2Y24_07440 [Pseudomonadaceae bacterium]|nr:hypothetical protein [Pseudomonadaceae bacterium]